MQNVIQLILIQTLLVFLSQLLFSMNPLLMLHKLDEMS